MSTTMGFITANSHQICYFFLNFSKFVFWVHNSSTKELQEYNFKYFVTDIAFDDYLGKWNYRAIPKVKTRSYFLAIPKYFHSGYKFNIHDIEFIYKIHYDKWMYCSTYSFWNFSGKIFSIINQSSRNSCPGLYKKYFHSARLRLISMRDIIVNCKPENGLIEIIITNKSCKISKNWNTWNWILNIWSEFKKCNK